jgi:signal transduction histidine kinase
VILSLSLLIVLAPFCSAQLATSRSILLLEDEISDPAVNVVERELQSRLDSSSSNPIEFYRESLDTALIPDQKYKADVRQWYQRKYANRNLDVIIAVGPAASSFLRAENGRLFPGIPIVLCLDQKPESGNAVPETDITGVWMDLDPVSTVNVARQLLPATKHVAVVSGDGSFDRMMSAAVKRKLQDYRNVDLIYLTGFDLSSLIEKFHQLPKDTVILYLAVTEDRSGRHFFARDTLALVSAAANVPVFGLMDLGVGLGMVGGRVTSVKDQAAFASGIVLRLLQGEKPGNIPAVTVTNRYSFDWKQLLRWHLDVSRLPAGSVVLNRDPGAWQLYWRMIVLVALVMLIQAGLLMYLLMEQRRRRGVQRALENDICERQKAEAALLDLGGHLISAQEEERSRIARELHDDFAQRLAMLTVNLERIAMAIPVEPENAIRRLRDLWDQTSQIGADLHTLSHNLHSSVLEVLGLSEGIRSLCAEFTAQRGVEVKFTERNIPPSIPTATSLCLFRIAQEALANVKKHSGTNSASIQLSGSDKEIELTISDTGVGFQQDDSAFKPGLGLRGMRERLRIVAGTIDIKSRPGGGTQVLVRVPLLDWAAAA